MKQTYTSKNITELLDTFIGIESVSSDSTRLPEVMNAAAFLKQQLTEMGFDVVMFEDGPAPPLIVASLFHDTAKTTIGIYGHYDVQAEDPVPEWHTAPFTLISNKGKFWGRGVSDNKGPVMQNIAAVGQLLREGKLTNNIVFILEGEEELGSAHLEQFVEKAQDLLKPVDVFMITDVGMESPTEPQIYYGLRGLAYFEVEARIGPKDLHSGVYGNQVYNPAQVITELISKMKDVTTGEVLIPGFYDDVRTPDDNEMSLLKKAETSDEELIKEIGGNALLQQRGLPTFLTSKILPSLDVNGMISGHTGEGSKTIIPKSATVKFSCRLVEDQDPLKIEKMVKEFVASHMPPGVEYTFITHSLCQPFYTDFRTPMVQKITAVLEKEFGNPVRFNRSGGSIPAAEILQRFFKKPLVLTGFTLPDQNMHSPNENMDEGLFWKGIEVLKKIYTSI